jgi:hypothetical protein
MSEEEGYWRSFDKLRMTQIRRLREIGTPWFSFHVIDGITTGS